MSEDDYPYVGPRPSDANECNYDPDIAVVKVDNCKVIPPNSSDDLKALLSTGPIAVQVEGDTHVFQRYKSGIFNDGSCGTTLDHAMLAVGWKTENNQTYLIVKNSWGTGWGEDGYMRIEV